MIVCVDCGVAEGVDYEEGDLNVAVEVDSGVIWDEGSAEIKIPSHLPIF